MGEGQSQARRRGWTLRFILGVIKSLGGGGRCAAVMWVLKASQWGGEWGGRVAAWTRWEGRAGGEWSHSGFVLKAGPPRHLLTCCMWGRVGRSCLDE